MKKAFIIALITVVSICSMQGLMRVFDPTEKIRIHQALKWVNQEIPKVEEELRKNPSSEELQQKLKKMKEFRKKLEVRQAEPIKKW